MRMPSKRARQQILLIIIVIDIVALAVLLYISFQQEYRCIFCGVNSPLLVPKPSPPANTLMERIC
jgi:hypothetical protein